MGQKKLYDIVNILVLILAVWLFVPLYGDIHRIFSRGIEGVIGILSLTAIAVHIIKAFRLYFAFYGRKLAFMECMKQYCKVVPVSMIVPLKLGDFFRAYCYGYKIQNYVVGILMILLDRFVDSLALVTMILLMNMVDAAEITVIFYAVLIFLVFVISSYMLFPGMYHYWKKYFLLAKASKRRNCVLKCLVRLNAVYVEISNLVKGRGAILYLLSMVAWTIEIGGLFLSNKLLIHQQTKAMISEYLTAALTGAKSGYLRQFVCTSAFFMAAAYLLLSCIMFLRTRGRIRK